MERVFEWQKNTASDYTVVLQTYNSCYDIPCKCGLGVVVHAFWSIGIETVLQVQ